MINTGYELKNESLYEALITQSGTSAPTAVEYKNEFPGVTFTWARTGAGVYTITASTAVFTTNKTVITMGMPLVGLVNYIVVPTSTTVITITTGVTSLVATVLSVLATDALLSNTWIQVRVY